MEKRVPKQQKKTGGLMEESARSAQRGLIVLLGSALVWLLAIWAGYQFL